MGSSYMGTDQKKCIEKYIRLSYFKVKISEISLVWFVKKITEENTEN